MKQTEPEKRKVKLFFSDRTKQEETVREEVRDILALALWEYLRRNGELL